MVAPDWICAHIPVEWVERYGQRLEEERLPKEEQERKQYANQVGTDGWMLLDALQAPCTPDPIENAPCRYHTTHPVGARGTMEARASPASSSAHHLSL